MDVEDEDEMKPFLNVSEYDGFYVVCSSKANKNEENAVAITYGESKNFPVLHQRINEKIRYNTFCKDTNSRRIEWEWIAGEDFQTLLDYYRIPSDNSHALKFWADDLYFDHGVNYIVYIRGLMDLAREMGGNRVYDALYVFANDTEFQSKIKTNKGVKREVIEQSNGGGDEQMDVQGA